MISNQVLCWDRHIRKSLSRDCNSLPHYHDTVLLNEAVEGLVPGSGKVFVDGTLGGGGHSEKILTMGATVIGVDQDADALGYADARLAEFGNRFISKQGNFSTLGQILKDLEIENVDGILLDLGVSSWHLDQAERGFSFMRDGALDMRMNQSEGLTAADIIQNYSEEDLSKIMWEFGDEKMARKISKAICQRRLEKPFTKTLELANFIEKVVPRRGRKIHPATKTFQALRITVNNELGVLKELLDSSVEILKKGGRICVISFHSLEDRIVKQFIKKHSTEWNDKPEWAEPQRNPYYKFKMITRKPIRATDEEVKTNRRSRSALLRIAEKL